MKKKEYINKKFNRLTVKEFLFRKHSNNYFRCLCDCGKEKVVSGIASKNDENSFFVYSTQNAFVFNQEVDMYQLYNLQGKLISKGVGKSFIENSNIHSGVYILKIVSKENTFLTKVVK